MALWSNSNGIFRRWVLIQRRRLLLSKTGAATVSDSVTEAVAVSDTVDSTVTAGGAVAETVNVSDANESLVTAQESVAEDVTLNDTVSGDLSGAIDETITEDVSLSDTAAVNLRRTITIYDKSGNGRDGTGYRFDPVIDWTTDTPSAYSPGHSLTFQSADTNVVEVADNAAFDATGAQSLSVFVDIKLPSTNTGSNGILRKRLGNVAANAGWGIFLNDGFGSGRPYVGVSDGTNNFNLAFPAPALNDDAWHTIGFVIDRGANLLRLVQDGSQVASTSISTLGDISNSRAVEVGFGSGTSYLDGELDNVRIYSGLTDSTDWGNIHDNTSPPTTNLELYFDFEDNPAAINVSVAEDLTLSDTIDSLTGAVTSDVDEDVTLSDVVDSQVTAGGAVSEDVALSDTKAGTATASPTVPEDLGLADTVDGTASAVDTVAEDVSLSDTASSLVGAVDSDVTEAADLSDTVAAEVVRQGAVSEDLDLADAMAGAASAGDVVAEEIDVSDDVATVVQAGPTITEAVSVDDAVSSTAVLAGARPWIYARRRLRAQ